MEEECKAPEQESIAPSSARLEEASKRMFANLKIKMASLKTGLVRCGNSKGKVLVKAGGHTYKLTKGIGRLANGLSSNT